MKNFLEEIQHREVYKGPSKLLKMSNDPTVPYPEKLNEHFATIGPLVSAKIAMRKMT